MLEILYQDDDIVAVNKPANLAVHRSKFVGPDDAFLIDLLREQVEGRLHLAHRLDRATSGVLLVARSSEVASQLGEQFMGRTVSKRYLAVVRGWPEPEEGTVDYPLPGSRDTGPRRDATTDYRRLATVEVDIPLGRYDKQRYALVVAEPRTGRFRQIRKHFAHIHHPIVGDSQHGRGDHNRLFKQHFSSHRLLLHAQRLTFTHPVTGAPLAIEAGLDATWLAIAARFGWEEALSAVEHTSTG
ncbi:pseudouridine synthase [Luteibacter aegosomaticola]|uniref:pseudouridine synthase n=1 Tax=Luteibacter aegosomaticola TaxID=2911538 RepID=UPI001FF7F23C|nr:pseudouridine synthase [Luteibacter aegosomaticola]UPG90487.1 pseudouridine synthase [Luteibacter aegosomaticola]